MKKPKQQQKTVKRLTLNYEVPFFEDLVQPLGALTRDLACHACFYYAMLAHKAIATVGDGPDSQSIVYVVGETPPDWLTADLPAIAKSVATMYGLESPEDFLKFRKEAWAQCKFLGITLDHRVLEVTPNSPVIH